MASIWFSGCNGMVHKRAFGGGKMDLLIHGDSLNLLKCIKADIIITDPPYGISRNRWDSEPIDFLHLAQVAQVVTTADIKYASFLINRYPKQFAHDLIWAKTVGSGQLNINNQPLRVHELVLVFKLLSNTVYNRIKTKGQPYEISRKIKNTQGYNQQRDVEITNLGERDMKSVLSVPNRRYKNGHPTQKPVQLFQTLADMYSNPGQTIIDPFAGSGTILDVKDRHVIAIEKDKEYYELARDSRTDSIVKKEHLHGTKFEYLMGLLSNHEYTVFSSKSQTVIQ